ncbi:MAG TPA: thymidine phosphorylase, partial [Clostridia bacterium]|nr:thymidine phosphorylase [Clostridia bacterium]
QIVDEIGLCVTGQTGNLDPADKLIYALRDVTGTVESVPLIASSIMSKKIASGADAIVLDVKVGSGAFMQTLEDARRLARTMVDIGAHVGRRTVAVITDMNQPLGMAVGNGLEMKEAIETLSGRLPEGDPLYEVCMLLASKMLLLANLAQSDAEAREKLKAALDSGAGLKKLEAMLRAMGGDTACVKDPSLLCRVKRKLDVFPAGSGYVADMDAVSIGVAAQLLGAGRAKKEDAIDPAVGLVMRKRRGDYIRRDEPLATLYVNESARLAEAASKLRSAVAISKAPPERIPMVYEVIE